MLIYFFIIPLRGATTYEEIKARFYGKPFQSSKRYGFLEKPNVKKYFKF
jgi:hypothetical protein